MKNNNILSELVNEVSKEILSMGRQCKEYAKTISDEIKTEHKEFNKMQEETLYKITLKNCDEEKLYYSDNENLITDVLDAVELEYKFIPFGKELLINVDEIIAIEKVSE